MVTVLHYTGYSVAGGGIHSVIRGLAGTGLFHVIHGVSPDYRPTAGEAVWHGPAIAGEQMGLMNGWRARVVARAVQAWLREDPARIFHGHSRAGLLVGGWLRRWGERRVVVSVHCYGRQRWFYRRAARALDGHLYWLTPRMRTYYGIPGTGWTDCIPGGVAERPDVAARPVSAAGLRLGGAGAFARWKRWELVLEALALLPDEARRQITFSHIGGPIAADRDSATYAEELRHRTQRLGLSATVRWLGPEDSSDRLLATVDVIVVPSDHEPYSMVIQEAWSAGVPVLASDTGGPADVVRPGETGWLFRTGDAADLARALRERLASRDFDRIDRATLRRSARQASVAAAEWAGVYASLG
jgi:glycosyltransferase involved in cell wall biosynthesis